MAKIKRPLSLGNDLEQKKSDQLVKFSYESLKLSNGFCMTELTRDQIISYFLKLEQIQKLTMMQFYQKGRDKGGFSIYETKTDRHKDFSKDFPNYDRFGHFRLTGIEGKGIFRVMGARVDDKIYILTIDHDGKLDH